MAEYNTELTVTKPVVKPNSLLKDFIAGGVGGVALVVVGHPLDTVKVKMQTMEVKPGIPPPYKGTYDCIQQTVHKDGFKGLYRGMLAPVMGVAPMYALCFFGYGVGKKIFCTENTFEDLSNKNVLRIAAAGATSGIFTTPILAPGERIKCLLQTQKMNPATGQMRYKGPMDCAKNIYREGGIRGVSRGFCATMLRDCIASGFYFATYEILKRKLTPVGQEAPGVGGILVAGGSAGMINWAMALPIDTLKSKLQTAPEAMYSRGIRSVVVQVVKTDGIMSLY
eukprot:Ihof_evm1s460 gene=Ihof_evmTU1s460